MCAAFATLSGLILLASKKQLNTSPLALFNSYGVPWNPDYPDGTYVFAGWFYDEFSCHNECPRKLIAEGRAFDGHSYMCTKDRSTI